MTLNILLQQGLTDLSLDLSVAAEADLIAFVELMRKWNRAFNLTAVRDPQAMVSHHILDSLSILPYVSGPSVLDIGSGAGLPGVPLAIALPEYRFTLLDSNGKKTRFLTQVVAELKLDNVEIVQERVERYHPKQLFNNITARAFGPVHDIIAQSKHLLVPTGQWLLMRGQVTEEELVGVNGELIALTVPGLDKQRNLVKIKV